MYIPIASPRFRHIKIHLYMCIVAPIDPHWYTYTHILLYIQIRLSIYRALIIQKNRGQTMHRYTDPWTETIIQDCIGFYWSESDFCKDLHSDVKKLKWRVAKNGCWTTPEQRRKMIQSFALIREREREAKWQREGPIWETSLQERSHWSRYAFNFKT